MASILKVDTIQDQSGNNIINESADTITIGASGDTITIPTGATLDLSNATQTGVGGTNTPAFAAYLGSNQSISNATITKMNYNTEVYDTDSAFDTSTYTFTIPSGGAGKYFFFARQTVVGAVAGDKHIFYLYKNNSQAALLSRSVGRGDDDSIQISAFVDASESDYFDIRYYHNFGGTNTVESNSIRTVFGAYKIIT